MGIVDQHRAALPVPFAIELADRIPKERYYDPAFFELEAELLWPRVWQMACRLEEIPEPFDFAEYQILDQSDRGGAHPRRRHRRARRHRLPERLSSPRRAGGPGPRDLRERVHLPVPRLVLRRRRHQHGRAAPAHLLRAQPGRPTTSTSRPVRCETWGGCAWINLDPDAPPLRECLEPFATSLDAWKVESLRTEWWYACRLPVNWKLAIEAFVEAYHVPQTHPQLVIPTRYGLRPGEDVRRRRLHRLRHPLPAGHERRHGRHGPRQRRARRRGPA